MWQRLSAAGDNMSARSYDSLFGRIRDTHKASRNFIDFLAKLLLLLLGTIGCTIGIYLTFHFLLKVNFLARISCITTLTDPQQRTTLAPCAERSEFLISARPCSTSFQAVVARCLVFGEVMFNLKNKHNKDKLSLVKMLKLLLILSHAMKNQQSA